MYLPFVSTIDSVVADIAKKIKKLETIRAQKLGTVARLHETAEQLHLTAEQHRVDADRAGTIKTKLEALIS